MKIKRILSVAATFVMALGLFTGCGAASTDTTTTTANNNTTAVQDTVKSTAASDSTTAQTNTFFRQEDIGCILFSVRKYQGSCTEHC